MKGQTGLEYMIIIAIILAIIIPMASYIWQQNEVVTRTRQAEITANSIASAADSLWAQGPGSKTTLNIFLPDGYSQTESKLSGRLILLKIYTPAGYNDAIAITKANITGSLPSDSGYKQLKLEVAEGRVKVS